MENNAAPTSIPDPDLSPENSPAGPGRAQIGTRRINNTPMVIAFVLLVLFLFVVIGVMYSRSKRQIAQNTEQHTSASKQADSIIPKQLAWTQAPVEPTPLPKPTPFVQSALPPAPVEPPADPINNARMQALQTALSAKPNVEGITLPKTARPPARRRRTTRKRANSRCCAAFWPGIGRTKPPVNPARPPRRPTSRA